MSNVQFILMDIEGTTTDIAFVHQVLFPYSAERLSEFVTQHASTPEVQAALQSVKETVKAETHESIDNEQAIDTLLEWICDDRKHGALKTLQGMIWQQGFEQGAYQGHVYDDVPIALEQWKQQGLGLGIYSSGSVQAQKLLFGHSVAGDLTPYFSHYFDTNIGGKKEALSYQTIAAELKLPPETILFLSDIEAELDAAKTSGFQTTQLVRLGTEKSLKHNTVSNFSDIKTALISA